nr:hypothetical protein [Candidatus Arsenophonus triatominarum]
MENLTELYCLMDDFCKDFEPKMHEILLNNGSKRDGVHNSVSGDFIF